jgi:hypothetical protein
MSAFGEVLDIGSDLDAYREAHEPPITAPKVSLYIQF